MRRSLRTVVAVAAASGALAYAGSASAAATGTPSAGTSTSSPAAACGPDGQLSMTSNTSLTDSQTGTPGHSVFSTTVITNKVGSLPHAEIRMQIIPEMQGVPSRPPLPGIEWSLDGGAWHNPQVSWITDASGSPYWMGPDLAIGTLPTGTHRVEVSFTFASGDLYGVYGAEVYVDADQCSAGGGLGTYGSGLVSAAFDGPAPGAGSGGGSGGSSGTKGGSSAGTAGTAHGASAGASASSGSASKLTATAAATASSSELGAADAPTSAATHAVGAQDVAAQNTAAASSFNTFGALGLVLLAAFALGGFVLRGRRLRLRTAAGAEPGVGNGDDEADGQDAASER